MNMRETKSEYEIPHFRHSEEYLDAYRTFRNSYYNLTRAMERIKNARKVDGRTTA